MHLSRESEYGLKAMIYLAQRRDLTLGSAVFYDTQVKVEGVDDD